MEHSDYLEELRGALPALSAVDRFTPLDGGHSPDAKYVAWEGDVPRYLLRLAGADRLGPMEAELAMIARCYDAGIPCPEPVACGAAADGGACYLVVGYIRGEGADRLLAGLPVDQQHRLGVVTGEVLRRMHAIGPQGAGRDVYRHHCDRHRHWLGKLQQAGVSFAGQDEVEAYVEGALGLLRQSPARFQHSDYHPAHLILLAGEFNGVIDFNRAEWTDPIRDFQRLPWFTCPVSLAFARGQIEGYCAEGVPADFWPRYNLFVALTLHRNAWAARVQWPHNLDLWRRKIAEIIATHDFAGGRAPLWFAEDVELIGELP